MLVDETLDIVAHVSSILDTFYAFALGFDTFDFVLALARTFETVKAFLAFEFACNCAWPRLGAFAATFFRFATTTGLTVIVVVIVVVIRRVVCRRFTADDRRSRHRRRRGAGQRGW